jgi:hypothetical protein
VTCNRYDVVVVPFPFTDRLASKRWPALALSTLEFSTEAGHIVLAMITSADNPNLAARCTDRFCARRASRGVEGTNEAFHFGQQGYLA